MYPAVFDYLRVMAGGHRVWEALVGTGLAE